MSFRDWIRRKRSEREARKLVAAAFRSGEVLRGTSLEPRHSSRWVLVDFELEGGRPARIRFGILRHPRPYAFSAQSHKVLEYYLYDVQSARITRLEGYNVTRSEGKDSD